MYDPIHYLASFRPKWQQNYKQLTVVDAPTPPRAKQMTTSGKIVAPDPDPAQKKRQSSLLSQFMPTDGMPVERDPEEVWEFERYPGTTFLLVVILGFAYFIYSNKVRDTSCIQARSACVCVVLINYAVPPPFFPGPGVSLEQPPCSRSWRRRSPECVAHWGAVALLRR